MSYKGRFKPKNPKKYKGNHTQIVWRSLWELKVMTYLDSHNDVLQWSSEEVIVPYINPIDGKPHRYFPDFVVTRKLNNGTIRTIMIEVKPAYQTKPATIKENATRRQHRRAVRNQMTYFVNKAKWEAAEAYCKAVGWQFQILTEKELGIKNGR